MILHKSKIAPKTKSFLRLSYESMPPYYPFKVILEQFKELLGQYLETP